MNVAARRRRHVMGQISLATKQRLLWSCSDWRIRFSNSKDCNLQFLEINHVSDQVHLSTGWAHRETLFPLKKPAGRERASAFTLEESRLQNAILIFKGALCAFDPFRSERNRFVLVSAKSLYLYVTRDHTVFILPGARHSGIEDCGLD